VIWVDLAQIRPFSTDKIQKKRAACRCSLCRGTFSPLCLQAHLQSSTHIHKHTQAHVKRAARHSHRSDPHRGGGGGLHHWVHQRRVLPHVRQRVHDTPQRRCVSWSAKPPPTRRALSAPLSRPAALAWTLPLPTLLPPSLDLPALPLHSAMVEPFVIILILIANGWPFHASPGTTPLPTQCAARTAAPTTRPFATHHLEPARLVHSSLIGQDNLNHTPKYALMCTRMFCVCSLCPQRPWVL
jgi:hypothetical protein